MNRKINIGILMQGGADWMGGVHYVQNLIRSLDYLSEDARPSITLLVEEGAAEEYYRDIIKKDTKVFAIKPKVNGRIVEGVARRLKGSPGYRAFCETIKRSKVDALFPMVGAKEGPLPTKWAGWIPDFQHVHLPEMFSQEEIDYRTFEFKKLAKVAKTMVFSSENALEDFKKFFPENETATKTLPFAAILPGEVFGVDRQAIRHKYRLPDKYLFLTNQFWKHKNHIVAFEAINILRAKGLDVKLYCSGELSDYRHPAHSAMLKRYIVDNGLEDSILVMGLLPRNDQIQLMRSAAALVQPSLFEGWSTVVEEGKTLGKVMFVSDIPVHFEQNAEHAIYFERQSPEDLADKIFNVWPELGTTLVNSDAEEKARHHNPERFGKFAANFTEIMRGLS